MTKEIWRRKEITKEEGSETKKCVFKNLSFCVFFSCMDIQRHSFFFWLMRIFYPLCVCVNRTLILKLFDVFFKFVFGFGGRIPSILIIRYLSLIGFKSQF